MSTTSSPKTSPATKAEPSQVEQLDHRLLSLRAELTPEAHRDCVLEYRRLLPAFVELERLCAELKTCFADSETGTKVERHRLAEIHEVLRLLERELYRVAYPDASMVPSAPLTQLIQLCDTELDKLYFIIRQRTQIRTYSETWWDVVSSARDKKVADNFKLLQLTNLIQKDVSESNNVLDILPSAQHLAISWSNRSLHEEFPFINGVMVARLMAYLVPQFPHGDQFAEQLTAAALLHDVGLIPLLRGHNKNVKELATTKTASFLKHPAHSAVVATMFTEMPVTFSYIVGQHHERLNGSGYPEKLIDKSLPPVSRIMAIVCRLVDLMTGNLFMHSPPDIPQGKELNVAQACKKLELEADLGELDENMVKQVTNLLQSSGSLELSESNGSEQQPQMEPGNRRDTRHDQSSLAPSIHQPLVTSWSWTKIHRRA